MNSAGARQGWANSIAVDMKPTSATSAITADAITADADADEYFNLSRDHTVIVGSHVEVGVPGDTRMFERMFGMAAEHGDRPGDGVRGVVCLVGRYALSGRAASLRCCAGRGG
jgi:hypothetical protein